MKGLRVKCYSNILRGIGRGGERWSLIVWPIIREKHLTDPHTCASLSVCALLSNTIDLDAILEMY